MHACGERGRGIMPRRDEDVQRRLALCNRKWSIRIRVPSRTDTYAYTSRRRGNRAFTATIFSEFIITRPAAARSVMIHAFLLPAVFPSLSPRSLSSRLFLASLSLSPSLSFVYTINNKYNNNITR